MKAFLTLNTAWFTAKGDIIRVNTKSGGLHLYIVVGRNGSGHIVDKIGWLAAHKIMLARSVKKAYRAFIKFITRK